LNHLRTLQGAALELATHLPLKQRLVNAYSKHLETLDTTTVPAALIGDIQALRAALTAHRPLPGESAVQATVRKLGQRDLEALAARLVTLYGDAARLGTLRIVEDTRADADDRQQSIPLSLQALA